MTDKEFEEDLYASEEMHTVKINNTEVKIKELPGKEFMDLLEGENVEDPNEVDTQIFAEAVIPECVVEPEGIEIDKLSSKALMKIVMKINEVHGTDEMMDEDFLSR